MAGNRSGKKLHPPIQPHALPPSPQEPNLNFALRHCATRLAEDGASATKIQALLGHESLNTSQGYIDATANATRQAARANTTYRTLQHLHLPTAEP